MRLLSGASDLTYFWWTILSFFGSALFFAFCFIVWAFQGAGDALIDRVTAFSAISFCVALFTAWKALSKGTNVIILTIANYSSVLVFFAVWTVWAKGDVHPIVVIVSFIYAIEMYLAVGRYKQVTTT